MTDRTPHTNGAGFEHQDLTPKPIFGFLMGLAAGCILVVLALWGAFHVLTSYREKEQPPQAPLAVETPNPRTTNKQEIDENIKATFPRPRLEDNERFELTDEINRQNEAIASYAYVDEKAGTVRIPIERAMELVAQRGLPVLPQGTAASAEKKPEKKAPEKPAKKK